MEDNVKLNSTTVQLESCQSWTNQIQSVYMPFLSRDAQEMIN